MRIKDVDTKKNTVEVGERITITFKIEYETDFPYDYPYDYPISSTQE